MFPNIQQYMQAKYGNLPSVELSYEDFIQALLQQGHTREKAEFTAKMAMKLGSSCVIGGKMVSIKTDV